MTGLHQPLTRLWFRRPRPTPAARMRLLCCPPAGAGAGFYRGWGRLLPAELEVLTVQYPGREDRIAEPSIATMAQLADGIAEAAQLLTDLPLALFGHSMGAAVAHEVARRLEGTGIRIEHLFVSGRPPPHRQRLKEIHRRDDDGVVAEITRLGGTPPAVLADAALRAMLLPPIRSDFRLIETYAGAIDPQLRAPVSALIGEADSEVDAVEAAAWAEATRGAFHLGLYPGGHFYLQAEAARLIRDIAARLPLPAWPCTP